MFFIYVAIVPIAISIYIYFKFRYNYWKKKNVPTIRPSFPLGNMENPFRRKHPVGVLLKLYYDTFKSRNCYHGGIYNFFRPVYIPIDQECIKNILQNDFQHFPDRGEYYNEKDDPLSAHLANIGGEKWKNLRKILTPAFTSAKLTLLFDTLMQCSIQMTGALENYCNNNEPIDIKNLNTQFTTDIIGSCAFGLECNSFKNPNSEFRRFGEEFIHAASKSKATCKKLFAWVFPELARFLCVTLLPKESSKFFLKVIQDTVKFRETNNCFRKDMLQVMIELKNNENTTKSLTIQEIAAQAAAFFVAGYETSSTTLTFCLFELARNQNIQNKVQNEIIIGLKKHRGVVTWESMQEMKYLDQVIDETLRKYPPIPAISRKCMKNYHVPNTDIEIEEGTRVYVPIMGLHYDDVFFPDPDKFDPDRFSVERRKLIPPYAYIPFGSGPRMCIGLRFGLMQIKLGLVTVLNQFSFTLNDKTELPLKLNSNSPILSNQDQIWLNATKNLT